MYTLKKVITKDNETKGMRYGENWYNRDIKFCPLSTNINNTTSLKEAVKFETKEEAEKHMKFWFMDGAYKVIKLKKK